MSQLGEHLYVLFVFDVAKVGSFFDLCKYFATFFEYFFQKSKKGSRTISRVMSSRHFSSGIYTPLKVTAAVAVIYLIGASHSYGAQAAYPPAMGEQPIVAAPRGNTLHMPVYMALQPIRRAAYRVATISGGLLPRPFTITSTCGWRLSFSVTLLCRHRQLPVREYGALCCPDFPLAAQCPHAGYTRQATRPSCYQCAKLRI